MKTSIRRAAACIACSLLFVQADVQAQDAAGSPWRSLFNGQDLAGWKQLNGDHVYEAHRGEIVGTTVPGQPNGFLVTEEEFGDFILELEVHVDVLMNNSGIQFRSLSIDDYSDGRVHGYQAEIDTKPQRWSGSIYDEARRGWLYIMEINPEAKRAFVNNTWNHYRIEAIGTSNRVWVNGIPTAHLVDDETLRGFIGLQLHANNPDDPSGSHQIRFRNIRIQTENVQLSPFDDIFVVNLIPNTVSGQERAQGFELLWDGHSTAGWSEASTSSEQDWVTKDGELRAAFSENGELRAATAEGGALVSDRQFTSYELKFGFKPLRDGATCAIHYLDSGDDAGDEPSLYCRMASQKIEAEQWNHGVIRVSPDDRVEYWLNGYKILEYRRDAEPRQRSRVRLLHGGGAVAYRSIKIRDLN